VVTIQYHQKSTSGRRKKYKTFFGKGIGIQESPPLGLIADQILCGLVCEDGKVEVGIESQQCESLLMPYKGLRSRYELVALTFQSVKSDLNNEWMTRVANAKVKLEFPPGWSFRCQGRQIWRII
jgi:hypothetical protein